MEINTDMVKIVAKRGNPFEEGTNIYHKKILNIPKNQKHTKILLGYFIQKIGGLLDR